MTDRRIESSETIRARIRQRLDRNRRHNQTQWFEDPPGPLPGIPPLAPAQITQLEQVFQASVQPIVTELGSVQEQVTNGLAPLIRLPQDTASTLQTLREDIRTANETTRQRVAWIGGRLDEFRTSAETHRNSQQQQLNQDLPGPLPGIPPLAPAQITQLEQVFQASVQPIVTELGAVQEQVTNGLVPLIRLPQDAASTLQTLQTLRDDIRAANEMTLQRAETHRDAQQQQLNAINESINTLDFPALQSIPTIAASVTQCHQATTDTVERVRGMQDYVQYIYNQQAGSLSNVIDAVGRVDRRFLTLRDSISAIDAQTQTTRTSFSERFDTMDQNIINNTRSIDAVERRVSSLRDDIAPDAISALQTEMSSMREDVSSMRIEVSELRAQVSSSESSILQRIDGTNSLVEKTDAIIESISSNITSKNDAQSEATEKLQADLLSQGKVLEVIEAAVRATSGSSSQEVEVLEEVSQRLDILKDLAPGVAALVKLLSKSASSTNVTIAASRLNSNASLQDELDRVEGKSPEESRMADQEVDASTLGEKTAHQDRPEGYDYRRATAKLNQRKDALGPYSGAMM